MNISKAVEKFRLDLLPSGWVKTISQSDFTEQSEIPTVYQDEIEKDLCNKLMDECIDEIKKCLDNYFVDAPSTSKSPAQTKTNISWNVLLSEYKICYTPLLCLISSFLNISEDNTTHEDRCNAICSARLYLNLLSIPGAWICKIFNPILFDRSIHALMIVSNAIQKDVSEDTTEIRNETVDLLDDLSTCLKELKLKVEFDSLILILRVLVDLTRLEKNKNVLNILNNDFSCVVAVKSYSILEQLCTEEHGDIRVTVSRIMGYFLPSLIIDNKRCTLTEHNAIKSHTFSFIGRLVRVLKEEYLSGVLALIRRLSMNASERSEFRTRGASEIFELLQMLPYSAFEDVVMWISCLAFGELVNNRMCALEVIANILNSTGTNNNNMNSNPSEKKLMKYLFSIILSRCTDISPFVRWKTLAILATMINSNNAHIREIVWSIFCDDTSNDKDLFDYQEYFIQFEELKKVPVPESTLPSANIFIGYIDTLTNDRRVFVKKNALLTLINILILNSRFVTRKRLEILTDRCMDPSVMARKAASKGLTELLLKYPTNFELIAAWVEGVIPLINDVEVKSKENATIYLGNVIIDKISPYSQTPEPLDELPWKILSQIPEKDKTNLFSSVCKQWSAEGKIKERLIKTLITHVGTPNNTAVWFLITCLSEPKSIPMPDFIYDYFTTKLNITRKIDDYLNHLVVTALCLNRKGLCSINKEELHRNLKISVENFQLRAPFIPQYIDMVYQFDQKEGKLWSGTLVKKCEQYLQDTISPKCNDSGYDEELLCQYVITLGEAANFCPGVNKDVISYIAHIIDPEFFKSGKKWKGKVSSTVKAASVITLGKLCIQDQKTTETYVQIFARNLVNLLSTIPVKVNSMAALTDLYIRFSWVVESSLPNMYVSLRDSDKCVRKNSFVHLTQIIQEEYLKLKSPLIFYLLIMLVDSSPDIRLLAEDFFISYVMRKHPSMLSKIFVHTIFFFNEYKGRQQLPIYNNMTQIEKKFFSIAGDNCFNDRVRIYKFMLKHMIEMEKFHTFNSVCLNILDEVVKNNIPMNTIGNSVLKDALFTMSCNEIRLHSARTQPEDEVEHDVSMDGVELAAKKSVVIGAARKIMINEVMKKNYIESIIPVIINLRKKLYEMKSPLIKTLMACLKQMLVDFKKEINEILAADPQLALEVTFDLRDVDSSTTDNDELVGLVNVGEVNLENNELLNNPLITDEAEENS